MTAKIWPFKDPKEVLDYGFDWSPRALGAETIITSTAVVKSGSVVVNSHGVNADGHTTTTWLSGGVAGEVCTIFILANTTSRVLDQTVTINIQNR